MLVTSSAPFHLKLFSLKKGIQPLSYVITDDYWITVSVYPILQGARAKVRHNLQIFSPFL